MASPFSGGKYESVTLRAASWPDHIAAIESEAIATERALLDQVRAALASEDEVAHGEAYEPSRGGLGVCAYCDGDWPCRTQRGIDRLLAIVNGEAS